MTNSPTAQDHNIMDGLQFVKVTIKQGVETHAGYLTDISCKLLLIELRRRGLEIVCVAAEIAGDRKS